MKQPGAPRASVRRHAVALAVLVALVSLGHLWLTREVAQRLGVPAADQAQRIQRMEAVYVSEMRLTSPPVAAAPPAPPPPSPARRARPERKPRPPEPAASAPDAAESAPESVDVTESEAAVADAVPDAAPDAPVAEATSAPSSAAMASVAPAASEPPSSPTPGGAGPSERTAQAPANGFVWPAAARVRFKMNGNYRGPIQGQGVVEWVRQGSRYQVHLDATVGPSFAPIGSWNLSSQGRITPQGLQPERYENVNRLLIRSGAPKVIQFDTGDIALPDGQKLPRPEGVQDPISQMIHLAYQFILRPSLAQAGQRIELPIASLRKVEVIAYDVLGEEVLDTPIGAVPTVHVRPRRLVEDNNNLSLELWFAPGLQYLPVRMMVRQGGANFMELRMNGAPQMGAMPPAASATAP
ncbi:MAG: DUF3108 domain-containing protein [Aquabacterium sp.]